MRDTSRVAPWVPPIVVKVAEAMKAEAMKTLGVGDTPHVARRLLSSRQMAHVWPKLLELGRPRLYPHLRLLRYTEIELRPVPRVLDDTMIKLMRPRHWGVEDGGASAAERGAAALFLFLTVQFGLVPPEGFGPTMTRQQADALAKTAENRWEADWLLASPTLVGRIGRDIEGRVEAAAIARVVEEIFGSPFLGCTATLANVVLEPKVKITKQDIRNWRAARY